MLTNFQRPSVASHAIGAGKAWYAAFTKPAYIFCTLFLSISLIFSSLLLAGCTSTSPVLRNFHLLELRYADSDALPGGFNLTAAGDSGVNGTLSAVRVGYQKICIEARFPDPKQFEAPAEKKEATSKPAEENEGKGSPTGEDDKVAQKKNQKRAEKDDKKTDTPKVEEGEKSWQCFTSTETEKLDFSHDPSNLLSVARTYKAKLSYTTPYIVTLALTALSLLFTAPNLFYIGGLFSCFSRAKPALPRPMTLLPQSTTPSPAPAPSTSGYPLWAQKLAAVSALGAVLAGGVSMTLQQVMAGAIDSLLGTVTMGGVIVDTGNSAAGFGWAAFALSVIAAPVIAALTMAAITADRLEKQAIRLETEATAIASGYATKAGDKARGKMMGMFGHSEKAEPVVSLGCGCACAACKHCTGVVSAERESHDSGMGYVEVGMNGQEGGNAPVRHDSFNRRLVGVMTRPAPGVQQPAPAYHAGGQTFQQRFAARAGQEAEGLAKGMAAKAKNRFMK